MFNFLFKRGFIRENRLLLLFAALKLFIHLVTGFQYGYFRDELYYFSMSEHLDFGYVDITPVVPWLMRLTRILFGDSLFAIHIFPAFAGAATVVFAGLTARKLGGGKFAVSLTAISVIAAPVFQLFNSTFTYDCFDQLMSAVLIYVLAGIFKDEGKQKKWLLFGFLAGIGLMVKISVAFLGLSLVIALLLTKQRRHFASKWLWIGGIVSFIILIPYVIWQISHGALILEYWNNYALNKTFKSSPLNYILMEIIVLNPLSLPLWISGLYYLLLSKEGNRFRTFGLMNLIYLILAIIMSFKFYLPAGTFFAVLAAGAISVEKFISGKKIIIIKYAYPAVLLSLGLLILPLTVPVLPVNQFIRLNNVFSHFGSNSVRSENVETAELPQQFADRFGWDEMVKKIGNVYNGLSPEEREKCAIFATNYGEAGAIDLFGKKYGLPKCICSHLSFYVWGPRDYTGEYAIVIGLGKEGEGDLKEYFEEVTVADVTNSKYAIPYENNQPIYFCTKLKVPLEKLWPEIKNMS